MRRLWAIVAVAVLLAMPIVPVVPVAGISTAASAQAGSQKAAALPADIAPITLTEAQLTLGKQQVDQMLRDRPAMAEYLHSGDPLYTWVVRQVSGGAIGDLILWSDDIGDYPVEYNACNRPPYEDVKGAIMLRRQFAVGPLTGKTIPADTLWACFVFELFNISNTRYMMANYRAALDGKVTRQEFITEGARNEFKSISKTATFYRLYWRPLTTHRHLKSDAAEWQANEPATFEAWIGRYSDPTQYPNSYWGKYYDDNIVPYRKAMEAYEKQLRARQ